MKNTAEAIVLNHVELNRIKDMIGRDLTYAEITENISLTKSFLSKFFTGYKEGRCNCPKYQKRITDFMRKKVFELI